MPSAFSKTVLDEAHVNWHLDIKALILRVEEVDLKHIVCQKIILRDITNLRVVDKCTGKLKTCGDSMPTTILL